MGRLTMTAKLQSPTRCDRLPRLLRAAPPTSVGMFRSLFAVAFSLVATTAWAADECHDIRSTLETISHDFGHRRSDVSLTLRKCGNAWRVSEMRVIARADEPVSGSTNFLGDLAVLSASSTGAITSADRGPARASATPTPEPGHLR